MKELDISSEEFRIYTYADGSTYRIDRPVTLFVIPSEKADSHRVIDEAGVTHRPTLGYLGISWKPRDGEPARRPALGWPSCSQAQPKSAAPHSRPRNWQRRITSRWPP